MGQLFTHLCLFEYFVNEPREALYALLALRLRSGSAAERLRGGLLAGTGMLLSFGGHREKVEKIMLEPKITEPDVNVKPANNIEKRINIKEQKIQMAREK